ncbi:cellulose biosynthesis protein BcsS [Methylobacterium dankookense]|nr:cellulose biosynthesis protein BcsS [Methylobacterium dankookense]
MWSSALLAMAGAARAADWYTGAEPAGRDAWIVAVDASTTVSSQGAQFAGATATAAPGGDLLTSGPRLRVDALIGSYRVQGGGATLGTQAEGAVMAGYAWASPEAVLAAYLGLDARRNELASAGRVTEAGGVGIKAALDLYARPTAFTMIHATASYASPFNAYYGRVRAGVAAFAGGYVGPEFALLGDDVYRQWRVGAHLSGMQLGALQLGLSGGYLQDQARKGGFYATLDLRTGF